MKLVSCIVLWTTVCFSGLVESAWAWGFQAHKLMNQQAVRMVPPPLQTFFQNNLRFVREHAIDPDSWRTKLAKNPNRTTSLRSIRSTHRRWNIGQLKNGSSCAHLLGRQSKGDGFLGASWRSTKPLSNNCASVSGWRLDYRRQLWVIMWPILMFLFMLQGITMDS